MLQKGPIQGDFEAGAGRPLRRTIAAAALAGLLALAAVPGRALQSVAGSDLARFAGAPSAGDVPEAETLTVSIALPWSHPADLNTLLKSLYDPKDPSYRRFLDPSEFAARFAPTASDFGKVLDFVAAQGLTVAASAPNRLWVNVRLNAGDVRRVFGVTLRRYRRPDGSLFRAPDHAPSVDLNVPLAHIGGLDDYSRPRRAAHPHAAQTRRDLGTGPGGAYMGYDFRDAYVPGAAATQSGSGQIVALVEFSGFLASDIQNYEQNSTPALPLNNPVPVTIDGGGQTDASVSASVQEASLDIELAIAMAPLATIDVYEGSATLNADTAFDDVVTAMATQTPLCRQISCSWYGFGDSTSQQLFAELAAQGQGFFTAAGDDGAYGPGTVDGSVPPPASLSPYLTVVGGTELNTTSPSAGVIAYQSESTWNDYACAGSTCGGGSSGGGICDGLLTQPWFQYGVADAQNQASSQWRDIPDVAMVAQDFWAVSYGSGGAWDGTSGATPLWAAFCALVNQQAAAQGTPALGFAAPALYDLAASPASYAADFHDIADGSNNNDGGQNSLYYTAVAGYDLCTGLGSPNGLSMLKALVAEAQNPALAAAAAGASGTAVVHFVTFPNPYDPRRGTLGLHFAPTTSPATLDVFDSAFREVNSTSLDPFQAALGQGTFAGTDSGGHPLAPGTYFAVLKAGGSPQTCVFTVRP